MVSHDVSSAPRGIAELPAAAADGRYRITRLLGQGGMAVVYEASDAAQGDRHVALKRLQQLPDPARQQRNALLFEREFHALAQLAHPRVVEVFDYGIDHAGPYYTMELLDGGDLQQLSPLPWREACATARDVCSALSLLHSRRLVHRDVSPRNVRRTAAGLAKLMDFGALAAIGPSKLVVGTPPCCAPESVQLRPLDGRTDLFGLGATLYYLLVGQHAYAARHFSGLHEAWQRGFARASALRPDVPEALDLLLLDLLRVEPDARPASAAEVMERIAAIDGAAADDQQGVARAYLSTPGMVGRDDALARVRRRLTRLTAGQPRNVLIDGPPGVGRSRFLDLSLLEASLLGMTVLRADPDDAVSGRYGVVQALARQLLELMPQVGLDAAQPALGSLAELLPALRERAGLPERGAGAPREPESKLQAALRAWLVQVSHARPLAIGVDDFQRIDEASAAVLALTAIDDGDHAICLLVATDGRSAGPLGPAQKLLLQGSTRIQLENLMEADVDRLFRSLFGDVPNADLLAQRAQALCSGNPRDLLRLSQHLIDRGVVRYDAGAWTLPAQLDAADLPDSIMDALRARIASLRPAQRELACALALCTDESFSFEECGVLCDSRDPAFLRRAVHALIEAELVRYVDVSATLALTHPSWVPLLRAELTPGLERQLNARLATVFEQRGNHDFLAGQHWLRGGERARAVDILVHHARVNTQTSLPLASLSARGFQTPVRDWSETTDLALQACDALGRPPRDRFALQMRATAVGSLVGRQDTVHIPVLLRELARLSGLEDYAALDPSLPAQERLMTALGRARDRYAALPERERVVDPAEAIRQLVRTITVVTGMASLACDLAYLRAVPDLTPLGPLAPVIATVNRLTDGQARRLTGSLEHVRIQYRELLAILDSPNHGGLEPTSADYTRAGLINAVGLIDAGTGRSCATEIEALETIPAFEVNALLLRMVQLLFQGDGLRAEHCRLQAERVRLQCGGRPMYGDQHLIWSVQAHAISEDLTRMRHAIEDLGALAKQYPGWQPILAYAVAEHHRIRGSTPTARSEIEAALRVAPPGSHQIWPSLATSHVLILLELGEPTLALSQAQANLTAAERLLGEVPSGLQLVASLAEARASRLAPDAADGQRATARADAAIEGLLAAGVSGIRLGFAHEIRARVALSLDDQAGFDRHAELCRAAYCAWKNPALLAKYQRLHQNTHAKGGRPADALHATPVSMSGSSSRIIAALESCRSSPQRAQLALTVLLQQSGASSGFLYTVGEAGVECSATIGEPKDAPELLPLVAAYLTAELESSDVTRTDSSSSAVSAIDWRNAAGQRLRPVLLSHSVEGELCVAGVAVLALPQQRPLVYPGQMASAISRVLTTGSGESSLMYLDREPL